MGTEIPGEMRPVEAKQIWKLKLEERKIKKCVPTNIGSLLLVLRDYY